MLETVARRLLLHTLGWAAVLCPALSAQAIDRAVWVENQQLNLQRAERMEFGEGFLAVGHVRLGSLSPGQGVSVYEYDAAADRWSYASVPEQVDSAPRWEDQLAVRRDEIFVGYPWTFGPQIVDRLGRDAAGAWVVREAIAAPPGTSSFGIGLSAPPSSPFGERLLVADRTELFVFEPDAAGDHQLVQRLPLATQGQLGAAIVEAFLDWAFVADRVARELIVLRLDAAAGQYAVHTRLPFPAGDFWLDAHSLVARRSSLLYGSSGGEQVVDYRYDASADTWSAHQVLRPSVTNITGTGFGADLALDGERLVVAAPNARRFPGAGGVYVYRLDAATDLWTEDRVLRGREIPPAADAGRAVAAADGRVAFYTPSADPVRSVDVTIFDVAADDDGDGWADLSEVGAAYCSPAVINFSYVPGVLAAWRPPGAATGEVELVAQHLMPNAFGLLLASDRPDHVPTPGGSRGDLCLGGGPAFGRYVTQTANSGPAGWLTVPVDLGAIPTSTGPMALAPGESWYFQLWYRDGPSSNFTDAVEVVGP